MLTRDRGLLESHGPTAFILLSFPNTILLAKLSPPLSTVSDAQVGEELVCKGKEFMENEMKR